MIRKIINLFNQENQQMINPKVRQRRRGTVIVDTNKGIILVGLKNQEFLLLPGGGAEFYETRRQAAIRKLD